MKKFTDGIRSILFNIAFFGSSFFILVLSLPAFLMSIQVQRGVSLAWFQTVYLCEKYVMGLTYEVVGRENLPPGPYLIAAKHQSAWETLKVYRIFGERTGLVAKKELLDIPIWGRYGRVMGLVPIDRSKGRQAMALMLDKAREAVADGRNIMVFPEGTRRPVGSPPDYKGGSLKIYEKLGIPLVPVAHNAGLFWPKNSFWKKSGKITVSILPSIAPGQDGRAVFDQVVDRIETETNRLCGVLAIKTNEV